MDAENYRVGAIYAELDADRRPIAFFRGGVNSPEQIPDTAIEIAKDVHRAFIESSVDMALAIDGETIESAPERVLPLPRLKEKAHARVDRDAAKYANGLKRGGFAGLLAEVLRAPAGRVYDEVVAMGVALDAAHDAIDAATDRRDLAAVFPIDFTGGA